MFKQDLTFRTPLMNAAGMLGFSPGRRGPVDLNCLGAFVTNPVSLAPRKPAENRVMLPFTGGFLLHTGLPNPGLRAVIQHNAPRWSEASLPVLVHILTAGPEDTARMVAHLEGLDNIAGIELGFEPRVTIEQALVRIQAALGELPVIACLPAERTGELAHALAGSGVSAFSLAAPRGSLPGSDGRLVSGRLYGLALLPRALAAVQDAAQAGVPIIGSGGVYSPDSVAAMQAAGATAIQLDAVLWRGGWN
jgi:dihydroorotate dehydrogenase (NAD+) catalytic subunit